MYTNIDLDTFRYITFNDQFIYFKSYFVVYGTKAYGCQHVRVKKEGWF